MNKTCIICFAFLLGWHWCQAEAEQPLKVSRDVADDPLNALVTKSASAFSGIIVRVPSAPTTGNTVHYTVYLSNCVPIYGEQIPSDISVMVVRKEGRSSDSLPYMIEGQKCIFFVNGTANDKTLETTDYWLGVLPFSASLEERISNLAKKIKR